MIQKICTKHESKLNSVDDHPIMAYVDIHGHSKRKSIFMYGSYYPLHSEKYLRVRLIPKILDDYTDKMFRFYACKFKNEKSK